MSEHWSKMEIPVSDFCFGITCKVEQPMGLDGVICKSSNDLKIGLGNYIKGGWLPLY